MNVYFNLRFLLFSLTICICTLVCFNHCSPSECYLDTKHEQCVLRQKETGCFRAAVFEHNRIDIEGNLHESIRRNLVIHNDAIALAAANGAEIIVLPEDGIVHDRNRNAYKQVLEEIPNPQDLTQDNNNPCLFEEQYKQQPILRNLSCVARQNNIYVVANYGTKEACQTHEQCPSGFLMLNTNVIFNTKGEFIRRYRKFNTYAEIFDKAPNMERVFFDTEFGRFGIVTCFDILFKEPTLGLAEENKIDTLLFPTWWYDQVPLLTAVQVQDAWSTALGVNMLAANVHIHRLGSIGSGIFSRDSRLYTTSSDKKAKLLIKSLPIKYDSNITCLEPDKEIDVDFNSKQSDEEYNHLHLPLLKTDHIEPFTSTEGVKDICIGTENKFCCSFSYKISEMQAGKSLNNLIFIVRDSLRKGTFQWYEQTCAVSSLVDPWRSNITLSIADSGFAVFDSLEIRAHGSDLTKYMFPISGHNVRKLVDKSKCKYRCTHHSNDQKLNVTNNECKYTLTKSEEPVYSAGLYGRVYERDNVIRLPHNS